VAIGVQVEDVNRTILSESVDTAQRHGRQHRAARIKRRHWVEELAYTLPMEARSKCIPGGAGTSTIALTHIAV
jgi:hypothetical protein